MRIPAFLLLITALLAASPASATRPQVVSVKETLIGVGPKFIFVDRELNDNMGRHSVEQIDSVLIAREILTNRDIYVWPLKRTLDKGADHTATVADPRVVVMPLNEKNNPWQIMKRHHGGLPNQFKATDEDRVEILSNADGVLISARTPPFAYGAPKGTPERTSYWLSYAALSGLITTSVRTTRDAFPAHFVKGADYLSNLEFDAAHECKFDYFARLSEQTDGEQQAVWATYVTCENEATMGPISMFIALPKLR